MRILLVYPQYTHSSVFDLRAPSMSLVYLAARLEGCGHEVVIYDASLGPIIKTGKVFRYGVSDKQVHDFLSSYDFDLVGITCSFTARWPFVSRMAQQVKEVSPQAPVAIGGLFPTSEWEYCLNNCKAVDFIMLGEAELSFAQIVNNLAQGYKVNDACKDIEGVAWRAGEKLLYNPKGGYNDRLDDLPFPAWHLVDLKKYFSVQKKLFELPTPCLPILSSRGCPYRCRFCNMYLTHGYGWRVRSPESVLSEIEYLIKRFGIRHFYFIDDNFNLDMERAKRICRGLIERPFKIKYNFYNGLSIKTIDYELLKLMKGSGCTSVCLAIESGSEYIRNKIYRKNLSTQKILEVFNWCHKIGIPTIGFFMVGAPGESRIDLEKTKRLLARLPMSLLTAGIYTPYPGTELYDECKIKGWLVEASLDDKNRVEMFSPMVKTPDFQPADVAKWQKELYLTFIRHHWFTLLKEMFRPGGVVNFDTIGRFLGFIKFYRVNRC